MDFDFENNNKKSSYDDFYNEGFEDKQNFNDDFFYNEDMEVNRAELDDDYIFHDHAY